MQNRVHVRAIRPLLAAVLVLLGTSCWGQTGCGDCNGDGMPNILDALVSAQIAAGILSPSATQDCACDVNDDAQLNVIDALLMAQAAAALPVLLTCPMPTCIGGNRPPTVTITSPTMGVHPGTITITFDLDDPDGDPCDLVFEVSDNMGVSYVPASSAGTGAVATNPALGVAGASGLTFDWDSALQYPGMTVAVSFRISATDGMLPAMDEVSFIADNSMAPPTCLVSTPVPGVPAGDIPVDWTAYDSMSVPVDLIVEFSTNGGASWEQASEGAGSSGTSALPTMPLPTGVAHVFVWRSAFDGVGIGVPAATTLQFTVTNPSGGTICTTGTFNVSN